MKYTLKYIFLAIIMLTSSCQEASEKNNISSYTFYKTYTINVATDNFIIISMRGFGPNNYLVLDLNANSLRIYSPYEEKGLLLRRKLKRMKFP